MIPVQILGKRKDDKFFLKTIRKINLEDENDIEELAKKLYYNYTVGIEIVYLIMYDFNGNIVSVFQCTQGDVEKANINKRSVASALVLSGVIGGFSMMHNHVSDKPEPSEEDFIVENTIKILSNVIGVEFYQNFIAVKDGVIDITSEGSI